MLEFCCFCIWHIQKGRSIVFSFHPLNTQVFSIPCRTECGIILYIISTYIRLGAHYVMCQEPMGSISLIPSQCLTTQTAGLKLEKQRSQHGVCGKGRSNPVPNRACYSMIKNSYVLIGLLAGRLEVNHYQLQKIGNSTLEVPAIFHHSGIFLSTFSSRLKSISFRSVFFSEIVIHCQLCKVAPLVFSILFIGK